MTTLREILPPGTTNWTVASARRAIAETNLLRDLLTSKDGSAHALLVEQARMHQEIERGKTMKQVKGPEGVEAVREAQWRLRGFELADQVLRERLRLGVVAGQKLAEAERIGLGTLPTPKDATQAAGWQAEAKRVLALVEKPGWDVLTRRWADVAWTAQWLKSVCPPEMAPLLDALTEGIKATVTAIETKFRQGMGAAAWFQDRRKSEGD